MKRWLVFLPLVFLLGAIALFGLFALGRNTRVEPNAVVGRPIPAITAPLLEGGPPVTLASQIQGKAMVNLFASWCTPCIAEVPALDQLKQRGVRLIGLAQRDEPANTARFLTRYGDPYDVILDDRGSVATVEFGVTGIPETFVVDSRGVIVGKHTGPLETQAQIDALMAVYEKAG
jgi:cytochrome c biogenesis protein CcmG/thiol:disulfide interchange protein DsbE